MINYKLGCEYVKHQLDNLKPHPCFKHVYRTNYKIFKIQW